MPKTPKVSVIMPTYNRAWILPRTIRSVLVQTFADFELLIVDDGSTDNTKEVLEEFAAKDKRIQILSVKHKGASAARNKALACATGTYIAYLDSDNIWYPNFLEAMLAELRDPYVMAYSGHNLCLVGGTQKNMKIIGRKVRNDPFNPVALLSGNYIDISAVMHTRSLLQEIGNFDEKLKTLEDWDLWLRIAIAHPFHIKHVDQILGEYHFFLKETATTVTNTNNSEESALRSFGLFTPTGNSKRILDKAKKKLEKT